MKFLILGCGSIGTRHGMNLKKLGISNFILCDTDQKKVFQLGKKLRTSSLFFDYKSAIKTHQDINAVIICTPTSQHVEQAIYIARKKINIFMEKPLSHSNIGINKLSGLIGKNKIIFMMGNSFIFDSGYSKIKSFLDKKLLGKIYYVNYVLEQFLPDWHPHSDYTKEYTARKDLGGGSLLTLGSHSFYLIEWLFGDIRKIHGKLCIKQSSLKIDADDSFYFIGETKNKTIIQITNNFTSRIFNHKMTINCENGIIEYKFLSNLLVIYQNNNKKTYRLNKNNNERYLEEMKYFLHSINKVSIDKHLSIKSGLRFMEFVTKIR